MIYTIKLTHVNEIRVGDTIEIKGMPTTVSGTDLHRGGFMGTTIFGDSYELGTRLVKRCVFPNPITRKQRLLAATQ